MAQGVSSDEASYLEELRAAVRPGVTLRDGLERVESTADSLLLSYESESGMPYTFVLRCSEHGVALEVTSEAEDGLSALQERLRWASKPGSAPRRLELGWWLRRIRTDRIGTKVRRLIRRAIDLMDAPGVLAGPSIPVCWWDRKNNFGDGIAPWLVGLLTGRLVHNAMDLPGPALATVGSVIQWLQRPGLRVWGSGLIRPLEPEDCDRLRSARPEAVHAVRGRLTRQELVNKLDWPVPEVFGDPAILLPRVVPRPAPLHEVAVVPHRLHRRLLPDDPLTAPDARLVDVRGRPTSVVRDIAAAAGVVSSSLHGLIVAQAYEIPWVRLKITDAPLMGDDFKFDDFFSTLDRQSVATVEVSRRELSMLDWRKVAGAARVPRLTIDPDKLLEAFPWDFVNSTRGPDSD
jgi:hypothetical protein